ncbi:MAG TPA: BTAD domain-containing putative transcriptional regulator, partial [Longimicrobiales bacterium]|nr:BTAD domain-containing putative transcriptional regulator [Longimicrobiales bacterium]
MIQLRVFGGATLVRTETGRYTSLSLPPKPLALLAYLALAAPQGLHRRDLLLALLWPKLNESRARNALSQAIFRIRSVIGGSALQSRGTGEIQVDTEAVRCDARDFDSAFGAGDWKGALDLYQGEFMAGLHVSGASGFERWQDMERARFQRIAYQAAWNQASTALDSGDRTEAALWLRRALEILPTDERALRAVMRVLDGAGEPTGALVAYEEQRHYLLRELDLELSAETKTLSEEIRVRAAPREALGTPRTAPELTSASDRSNRVSALAVLPFHNLTGDPGEDYFADGMTDALITALGRIGVVRVISRQSSLAYRGTQKSLPQIADELRVDGVVEGSVLRVGNRIRITAQLIQAHPEAHLWAESYDRTLEDVLEVHAEVAWRIAGHVEGAIPLQPGQPSKRAPRVDPAAYEAFLKGRHYGAFWPEIGRGVEFFEQAIARDPGFAPAHAGLALCYFNMAAFVLLSPGEVLPRMEAAARQALVLDDSLSDAHVALGLSLAISGSDWPEGTERELRRAVDLDPNNAYARTYLGGHRIALAYDDGLAWCEQGLSLDPLNPWMLHTLGWAYYRMRRYAQAEQTFRSMLEMHPHLALPHPFLAQVYLQQDRPTDAVDACRRARERQPEDSLVLGYGAAILALSGQR